MTKQTFTLTLELDEKHAKQLVRLQELHKKVQVDTATKEETKEWSYLWDKLEEDTMNDLVDDLLVNAKPLHETSVVCWLPVNGTIPPEEDKEYLINTDPQLSSIVGWCNDGIWWTDRGTFEPTHYAELPKLEVCHV